MQNEQTKKKERKDRSPWIIIAVLIIIIILLLLRSCGKEETNLYVGSGEIVQGEINVMSQAELQQKVDETVAKGMFQVFMNTKITVDNNNVMNLKIQNNKSNHYDCYVAIYKGEDMIYKSSVISPSYKLESDTLQYDLENGTHECIAYFCVLNNDGNEINRVGLEITLTK